MVSVLLASDVYNVPPTVTVTFSSTDYCSLFLKKSPYTAFLLPALSIVHLPLCTPSSLLMISPTSYWTAPSNTTSAAMKPSGISIDVASKGYNGIQNGTRVVKMELQQAIQSFLCFSLQLAFVKHDGQVPTCRKCHLPDHVAHTCPNVICFNCDQLGHTF